MPHEMARYGEFNKYQLAVMRLAKHFTGQTYNVLVKRFPNNLFATMFNFMEAPYYQIPEAARTAPKVDMSGIRKK